MPKFKSLHLRKIQYCIISVVFLLLQGVANVHASDVSKTHATVTKAAERVYRLLVETGNDSIIGGSAFLVSGSRIIATNHHVIRDGVTFHIGMIDGDGKIRSIPARIVASYPQKDLALIEALDDLQGQPLPLEGKYPELAQELFAIGYPAAADIHDVSGDAALGDPMFFAPSVLKGYVSRVLKNRWYRNQLQHQTPIVPGYSGGPLISPEGGVFGISTSVHKEAPGVSYGVLAADLIDLLNACSLPANILSPSPHIGAAQLAEVQQNTERTGRKDALLRSNLSVNVSDELIDRANALLDNGDIAAARLMFDYLRNHLELPEIYIGLARTYDPIYLRENGILGIKGDEKTAQRYYHLAATLMRKDQFPKQDKLVFAGNHGCNNSYCELVESAGGSYVSCTMPN